MKRRGYFVMEMKTKKQSKSRNLHAQILRGYVRIIIIVCILGGEIVALLGALFGYYQRIDSTETRRLEIQQVLVSHYSWRDQLSSSLQTGGEFNGSLDPANCSFGQWVQQNIEDAQTNPQVAELVRQVEVPHDEMHNAAAQVLETRETDPEAAMEQYLQEVAPRTDEVIQALGQLDEYYTQQVDAAKSVYNGLMLAIFLIIAITIIGIVLYSLRYANRFARQISRPVVRMSEWANHLSLGMVDTEADDEFRRMAAENRGNEIGDMMEAFQTMAENLQQNVQVLRRVADGDMTSFVHVHSEQDSLGLSLYHLVQSNDEIFGEIMEAAHVVATNAGEIARVSHTLAESSTEQAAAVEELSATIEHTSDLIHRNDEQAQKAKQNSVQLQEDTETSNQHMKEMVERVDRIKDASQRISQVVKSIEDIAFETNILSLNAAIEAARAGSAGKGFAVVADEVRALALKSSEAAKESKELIERCISETEEGSAVALESATIFDSIYQGINQIAEIVEGISKLSYEQMEGITNVNSQISQITETTSSNAAIAQQSSAASQDMDHQAELLRKSIERFKLRKRNGNHAYIPPEKQNDPDYISFANQAYQHKVETGKANHVYIDRREGEAAPAQ